LLYLETFARIKKIPSKKNVRYEKIAHRTRVKKHGLEKHKATQFSRCTCNRTQSID
jgi:hypothetical protein